MKNWLLAFLPDHITEEELHQVEVKLDTPIVQAGILEKQSKYWVIWEEFGLDTRAIRFDTRDEALLELGGLTALRLKDKDAAMPLGEDT